MTGDWRTDAACLGAPPAQFFTDSYGQHKIRLTEVANRYCRPCPVRGACNTEADQLRDIGLRGGVYRAKRSGTGEYSRYPLLDDVVLLPLLKRPPGPSKGCAA